MIKTLLNFGRMIKFSHTIFALPFAFSGAVLALQDSEFKAISFLWILLAMIGARTAAMGFNRLVDSAIDAKNPRTKDREIPSGLVSKFSASLLVVLSSALLVFSAYQLNMLCFYLSPIALLVVLGYSLTKRFTAFCHLVLGLGLALAPLGAWLALTGEFHTLPIALATAVLFWVSGFDIIYACQDFEYDKENGLFSIPVHFGLKGALLIARSFHLIAFILFCSVFFLATFHMVYLLGLALIGIILIQQHRLISPQNLEKVGFAFFNMNGTISIIYFITILANHVLL